MKTSNAENSKAAEQVFLTHHFRARRELVFEAWTDPEQLTNWYAPEGCSIHFTHLDIREGGTFHSCIHHPTHGDCWCVGTYKEITAPEKLVFTLAVSDEQGNLIQPADAGMSPDWPAETTVVVLFEEEGNQTKLTLTQTVSAALASKTGALPSWIQMFERLNRLL